MFCFYWCQVLTIWGKRSSCFFASINCTMVVVCLRSIYSFQLSIVKIVTNDPAEGNLCFCSDLQKTPTQYILLLLSYFLFTLHAAHEPVLSCFINEVPAQSFFSFHLSFTLMIISAPMSALHRNHKYYCWIGEHWSTMRSTCRSKLVDQQHRIRMLSSWDTRMQGGLVAVFKWPRTVSKGHFHLPL